MGNLGSAHTLGFKPQTVAGTPEATVNTFLSTESVYADAGSSHIERKTFAGTGRRLASRKGTIEPNGKSTTELMASQPHPWYWAMGGVVETGADGVFKQVITEHANGPVLLTCEADQVFGVAKQGDVKISKLNLKAVAGDIGKLDIEWLGISHEDDAAVTSVPVFVTDVLTMTNCSIVIDGTPDLTVQEVELTYDPMLEAPRVLNGAANAPGVVRRKEATKVNGKIKWIDFSPAEQARLREAESFAIVMTFTGGKIGATASDAYLKITLPACQYTGGLDPNIADSLIMGEADFDAFYDLVTGKQIEVESQNGISTIVG